MVFSVSHESLLITTDDTLYEGYRAVRIKAIFVLPVHAHPLHPEPLIYAEYFSRFTSAKPSNVFKFHAISHATSSRGRETAVLPLSAIKLACHIVPRFHRVSPELLQKDSSRVDLLEESSSFYLNSFGNRLLYSYLNHWNHVTLEQFN